ncbi:tripartite-type tricarboxylate transporter receptor subunit TctC [Pseudacidovorax intermedius]|uniref:Tripartite-type tricarboxylate transporter receptor subunit TctC n=1 Tax=Pseudacidovorax intermedius TaxID=433924 RepID=A0A370F5M5_9BURK|nr:tripartite tricarboxylate transporter substrate binding protein [Pseudacidovorax intermedius]RDI16617.1 tripartite-type tricarboxylate transporter receptor subunit TctC [Pseudacidovorax intermedius]
MNRRKLIQSLAALGPASVASAFAQEYPARQLRLLVPYTAGGGTDLAARVVMKKLSEQLGQPIIVENKPGGGAALAYIELLRSKPDGYVLTTGSGVTSLLNLLNSKLPFDAATELVQVAPLASVPIVLVASNKVPAGNVAELIAYVKQHPGLSFGTPGPATPHHLAGVLFASMAGLQMTHVGYRGTAPAVQDVVGGHLPLAIVGLSTAIQFARSGQLKVLGVGSSQRSGLAPDIPTLAEGGLAGYDASYWYDICVASGVPQPVVERLHAGITKAVQDHDVRAALTAAGLEPMAVTRDVYRRMLRSERAKWEPVIRANNIQMGS